MTILRSRDNPRIRRWRKLITDRNARRRARCAWIEGTRLVAAYLGACGAPVTLVISDQAGESPEVTKLVARAGIEPVVLSAAVFASLADTETPQGIAAEIEIPDSPVATEIVAQCVFLDGVADPGNLGAILRSVAAFGVPEVVLGGGCADPWAPKVLRAAMGAHFSLRAGDRLCTVPRGGTPLHEVDLRGRHAWVFGSEGKGVRDAVATAATRQVCIPMAETAESLNVAVAASICLYEAARQRRAPLPHRQ
ncbi:MAG: hypothetical protein AMJ64_10255 [Betaproteobacteria bacterium SG8_39]|nr:MAG: hypothetical protein AMJ64_10255 [Betaproteobacteria bacterium SG8_39]